MKLVYSRILLVSSLFSTNVFALENISKSLCGEEQISSEQHDAELKARAVEFNMPPIQNQGQSFWCSVFVSSDHVNYHNFTNQKEDSGNDQFYLDKKNLISPIDAKGIATRFRDEKSSSKENPNLIDLFSPENSQIIYIGLQNQNYAARSLDQVGFNSIDENNKEARKLAKSLIAKYKKENKGPDKNYIVFGAYCPVKLYEQESFQEEMRSFKLINSFLYSEALKQNNLVGKDKIKNYNALSQEIFGTRDLKTTPYIIKEYSGNDIHKYLQLIKKNLYPKKGSGRPIEINLCTESLNKKTQGQSGCNPHAMSVVGAYNKNGKCIVRLRNTWGPEWGDQGHINMPVEEFLKSVEKLNKAMSSENKYSARWLSNNATKDEFTRVHSISDKGSYTGQLDLSFDKTGNHRIHKTAGFRQNEKGEKVEAYNIQVEDNRYFSGSITEEKGEKWKVKSGTAKNKEGKFVWAYNYKFSNGLVYTGPLIDLGGGRFQTKR